MRRFIIASHHLYAYGLTDTISFLTGNKDRVYDISAYMNDETIDQQINKVFKRFNEDDEIIIMTDMMGGSVNQKFYPFINHHVHLICGVNVPLALALVLRGDEPLNANDISQLIEEAKQQIIYVNDFELNTSFDDE